MDLRRVIPVTRGSERAHHVERVGFRVTHARYPTIRSQPHVHERAVCTVVLDGFWNQALGERRFECGDGGALTKPAGARHSDRIRAGTRMVLVEVGADGGDRVEPCTTFLAEPRQVREPAVFGLAWRMARELDAEDPFTPVVVEGLALELVGVAARREAAPAGHGRPRWLERARELIHEEFHTGLHVADLAQAVDVHPVRLARGFRAHLGLSPGQYLRRARLNWAAGELVAGDRPVAEIAARGGFADQSHFTRAFRRYTGLTPARYRLTRRKGLAADD